jgi:ketose-bisphosphate aldolase
MSLVTMKSLMKHALENRYAVGYFEAWNMESVLAVIDAAEKTNSPVIIGFGGMFISNKDRRVEENIYHYGALAKAIAVNAKVPAALLLNEADRLDILVKGLKAGFNAVMYQNPADSFEETIEKTKYLAVTAHYCGADVEAEVGELPTSDISTNTLSKGTRTDPGQAAFFVEQTGIDALAVAVGNVHLLEGRKAELDLDLIRRLRKKIKIPLVLHGGTGVSEDGLKEAINLGMCKINVGTVMKRVFIDSMQEYFKNNDVDRTDPHDVIGRGGKQDMLCRARGAVTEEIVRFIKIFGSENKAGSL